MLRLSKIKYHYFPPLVSVWFSITFGLGFGLALYQNHLIPYFPFISDIGTTPPESCIFGQMLDVGALLYAYVVYIRYKQFNMLIEAGEERISRRYNLIAVWTGFVSCFGLCMVGNFQETNALWVHVFGSVLAFGIGGINIAIMALFAYRLRDIFHSYPQYEIGNGLLALRIVATVLYQVFYWTTCLGCIMAIIPYKGLYEDIPRWSKEDGGYEYKLLGAGSEWCLALACCVTMGASTREVKLLQYEEDNLKQKYASHKTKAVEASSHI